MKVLVTGATGFVGGHLVDALVGAGAMVTALARSPQKAAALAARGVRIIDGHLHTPAALAQAVQDQDIVYHVAGAVAGRHESDFLHANRDGTRNVVVASEAGGARRFVLVSSLAAAGPAPRGLPLEGTETPRPVTAYGRSKLEAERLVRESRLPWSIVRPPMVYGPRDREVLKVFRIARLGIAPIFGDGSQELSAIHASDLAAALRAVGESSLSVGRTYHACHPEVFSSWEFCQAVAAVMGRSVSPLRIPQPVGRALLALTQTTARIARQSTILTIDKANEFFQPAWTGNPAPLMRDCGWQPEYDLRRGLADTYQWYRGAGWL
jgi:nucleoside-diphosphate-sugar epimerase